MYKDIESLYWALEANTVSCVNYTSIFKKCGKSIFLLVSHVLGCCNKISKTRWPKTIETFCLAALGARGPVPCDGPGEGPRLACFWCLLAASVLAGWQTDRSCHTAAFSVFVAHHARLSCVWIFPFYQDTTHTGLDLIRMTSFELDNLGKDPISKYSHILRYRGLGFQHKNLGGRHI